MLPIEMPGLKLQVKLINRNKEVKVILLVGGTNTISNIKNSPLQAYPCNGLKCILSC